MKESFLHYLWKHKKIPFHRLQLTNGDQLLIKNSGEFNHNESGPDFINGQIEINGITWVGNIEMHVKSSDWYVHQHQYDSAYNNVVLHVVYQNDKDVYVNGQLLPTIELIDVLDYNFFYKTNIYQSNLEFPCEPFLERLDCIYFESMKSKAIVDRLNRKMFSVQDDFKDSHPQQILYMLLARAFGNKVNSQPFEELSRRVPLKILKKEIPEYTEMIIKNVSGIYNIEKSNDWLYIQAKYNFEKIQEFQWKYKGLRPASFPKIRIQQFINVIEKFDFETSFIYLNTEQLYDYLNELLELNDLKYKISKSMKDLIIINCFVPFIWWYGNLKVNIEIQEKSLNLLSYLKPEKNYLTYKWLELGIEIRNSFDSQAFLEIYNEFCKRRKCLQCDVGHKIVNL